MNNKKKTILSRRRFIAFGCLGAGGALWVGTSRTWAAGFLRERFAEVRDPVAEPKFKPMPARWSSNGITISWLGHSTVLINFYGVHILTDPVLFNRVGAHVGLGTIGPKRLVASPLRIRELPPIDLVLLSHAHMDHLDTRTLKCFSSSTRAVTARRTADILAGTRLSPVTELGWGDRAHVQCKQGDLFVEAFPVKHWGARWRRDTYRGYNGYILEREGKKLIFGGDTAMSPSFAPLRGKGPFEVAIMPIGAYQPWVISHCNPEEAVSMANAAGASYLVPIHHQTFRLGRERRMEPIERLQDALAKEPERLALRDIGETFATA